MCMYFIKYYRFLKTVNLLFIIYYEFIYYEFYLYNVFVVAAHALFVFFLYYEIINTRILSGTYIITSIYVPNFIVHGWSHEKDKQFMAIDRAPVVMLMFIHVIFPNDSN